MNNPYRINAKTNEEKKACFLFHNWEIFLKPTSYNNIINNIEIINNKKIYKVDIFKDYILKCSKCEKEKEMPVNFIYLTKAIEHFKKIMNFD